MKDPLDELKTAVDAAIEIRDRGDIKAITDKEKALAIATFMNTPWNQWMMVGKFRVMWMDLEFEAKIREEEAMDGCMQHPPPTE